MKRVCVRSWRHVMAFRNVPLGRVFGITTGVGGVPGVKIAEGTRMSNVATNAQYTEAAYSTKVNLLPAFVLRQD